MKLDKLKFLNVVDNYYPEKRRTIIYSGELRPDKEGFSYLFTYGTGKDWSMVGVGVVGNGRYSGMSSEEIELTCLVEDPPSPADVYAACIIGDMTPERADAYARRGGPT